LRLRIQKYKHWIILFLVFFACCLIGIVFVITLLTPSHHNYETGEQTEEQAESEKTGTYYVYGGAHGLPLCDAPSKYAGIITVIPNRSEVEIISAIKRGYYKVRYKNKEGYVKSRYLLKADQKVSKKTKRKLREDYPLYYVIAEEDTVNMYKKKSSSSKVRAKISVGYSVRILEKTRNGYCRVAYKNKIGYISAEHLTQFNINE